MKRTEEKKHPKHDYGISDGRNDLVEIYVVSFYFLLFFIIIKIYIFFLSHTEL